MAILITLLLVAPLSAAEADTPDEPLSLFNGKDLSGWTTWLVDTKTKDPRDVFSVEAGELRISGDGYGYLATKATYHDYRLVIEYHWGKRQREERKHNARESGLFLHAVGPDGNSFDGDGAYKAAIECQIMQGAVGDFLLIKGKDHDGREVPVRLSAQVAEQTDRDGWPWWQPKGKLKTLKGTGRLNWRGKSPDWKDVLDFHAENDVKSALCEWTRVECVCRGAGIVVHVNDKLVNRCEDCFPAAGQILPQCEGSEIVFRRVELLPLK